MPVEYEKNIDRAAQRAKRDSVFRTARVVIDAPRREVSCRVRNISETGACIDHKGELTAGLLVQISIGKDQAVAARVMWVSEKLAGVAFAGPQGVPDASDAADPLTPTAGWLAERPDPYRR